MILIKNDRHAWRVFFLCTFASTQDTQEVHSCICLLSCVLVFRCMIQTIEETKQKQIENKTKRKQIIKSKQKMIMMSC